MSRRANGQSHKSLSRFEYFRLFPVFLEHSELFYALALVLAVSLTDLAVRYLIAKESAVFNIRAYHLVDKSILFLGRQVSLIPCVLGWRERVLT